MQSLVISLLIILFSAFSAAQVSAVLFTPGLKFAAVGNIKPITDNKDRLNKLIESINQQKPDYVFILGDSGAWDTEIFKIYQNKIKAKTIYAPGNYDLTKKHEAGYIKNVGYTENLIRTPQANFIILNSSQDIGTIKDFLADSLNKIASSKLPTILMTHHRIWDDTLLSRKEYKHHKSYLFSEIHPLIKNKVDYIFAGNSNKQYFGQSKKNTNTSYWLSKFGNMDCYSIGMGNGIPKATYVTAQMLNARDLYVKAHYSSLKSSSRPNLAQNAEQYSNKVVKKKVHRTLPGIKRKAFLAGIAIGAVIILLLVIIGFILGLINIPKIKSKGGTKGLKSRSL